MSIFNDNNGVLIGVVTAQAFCTILAPTPSYDDAGAAAVNSIKDPTKDGTSCQLISGISWIIAGNGTSAGTVDLQKRNSRGVWRTVTVSPFQFTVAANAFSQGTILAEIGHGYRFLITLSAGGLTVCELMGISIEGE